MSLKIFNSLGRELQEFEPIIKGRVHIYVCGPTVYDYPHIGHAKSYISFDVVVRYFRYLGYKVRYVQNITDVGHLLDDGEDRILKGAKREKLEPMELVERYTRAYFDAMDALNVLRPDISPHAAGHIPEQIEWVETLLEKGYAYNVKGSVYFDISKWPGYGKLSGRKVDDQQAGARLDVNTEKKHPADFALWKKAEPEHIMQWKSPWGMGYPGWHLECSTMSTKYLGETFDIHGGGLDNQFPHHECEIAQAEAATEKPFARYWMHNNMVLVDGNKMSKSLGNFTTLSEALEQFSGTQIRFFILQTHYRSPVDFTQEAVYAAAQGLSKLQNTMRVLNEALNSAQQGKAEQNIIDRVSKHRQAFEAEMNNDFNTPSAIGMLFEFSKEINKWLDQNDLSRETLSVIQQAYYSLGEDVLGILSSAEQNSMQATPFIDMLVNLRKDLREQKNWELADWIRDNLQENGVEIRDSKQGTRYRIKNL
ncbi:MAG: cysteine--tRNA ligase [candidate division KSB1 bacterium]|nr:cysteine--tRNA ligase [candidate division KSB1 bacterium]